LLLLLLLLVAAAAAAAVDVIVRCRRACKHSPTASHIILVHCTGLPCAHEIKVNGMSFAASDVPQRYHKKYAESTDPTVFLDAPVDIGGIVQTRALPSPTCGRRRPLRPGRNGNWRAELPEPVHLADMHDDDDADTGGGGGGGGGGEASADDDGRDDEPSVHDPTRAAAAMAAAKLATSAGPRAFLQHFLLPSIRSAEAIMSATWSDETALDTRELLRAITARVQSDAHWLRQWRHALEERVPHGVRLPGDDSRESVLAVGEVALLQAQATGQMADLLHDAEEFDKRVSAAQLVAINRLDNHAAKVMPGRKRARIGE
jgi:hypothetical protein